MQNDQDIKNAVEDAFGPGAFELIAELDAAEMAELEEFGADNQAGTAVAATAITSPIPQVFAAGQGVAAGKRVTEPPKREQPKPEQQTLLLFELADTCFGVSLANVVEIQQVPRITRIMRGPKWLQGLANLRGTVISVVNLQLLLGRSPVPRRHGGHLIVVRSLQDANLTGLIVDSVLRIRGVALDAVEETAAQASANRPFCPWNDRMRRPASHGTGFGKSIVVERDATISNRLAASEVF